MQVTTDEFVVDWRLADCGIGHEHELQEVVECLDRFCVHIETDYLVDCQQVGVAKPEGRIEG
jgi:hypothetical protein